MSETPSLILPRVRRMKPYRPPLEGRADTDCLRLDFNERTQPVSPRVRDALIDYLRQDKLQIYPEYGDLTERLASYAGVQPGQLLLTNGSDQGIDVLFRAVAEPGDEAIVPVPTFAMLVHSAELAGLTVRSPAYTEEHGYPTDAVLSSVSERTRVIVVCNPNSPTGTLTPVDDVLQIAKQVPQAAILVDECYFEYSKTTVKDWIGEFPNLFVSRTLSKTWGLPSLRIGYMLSHEANIDELLKVRGPYDVNRMAVVAASAALDDPSYMSAYVEDVLKRSQPRLLSYLDTRGLRYWPTSANFVLLYPPDADSFVQGMLERKILVRPRSGRGIDGSVRITMGTPEETEQLIAAMDEVLAEAATTDIDGVR